MNGKSLFCLLVLPLVAINALTSEEFDQFGQDPNRTAAGSCQPWSYIENRTDYFLVQSNGIAQAPSEGYKRCNGNNATEQRHRYRIPQRPLLPPGAEGPSGRYCVGTVVGILKDGIPLYNAYNVLVRGSGSTLEGIEKYEAGDEERFWVFDGCDRHASTAGVEHYHYASRCLDGFMGVALDGHAIYKQSPSGVVLDVCHGAMFDHRNEDGEVIGREYRYYMNYDSYPYGPACFRGQTIMGGRSNMDACDNQQLGELCVCNDDAYNGDDGCQEGRGQGRRPGGRNNGPPRSNGPNNRRRRPPPPPPRSNGPNNRRPPPPPPGRRNNRGGQQQPQGSNQQPQGRGRQQQPQGRGRQQQPQGRGRQQQPQGRGRQQQPQGRGPQQQPQGRGPQQQPQGQQQQQQQSRRRTRSRPTRQAGAYGGGNGNVGAISLYTEPIFNDPSLEVCEDLASGTCSYGPFSNSCQAGGGGYGGAGGAYGGAGGANDLGMAPNMRAPSY